MVVYLKDFVIIARQIVGMKIGSKQFCRVNPLLRLYARIKGRRKKGSRNTDCYCGEVIV